MRERKNNYLRNFRVFFVAVLVCQFVFCPLQVLAQPPEIISTVTIAGVTAPKIGANPDFSFEIPGDVNYSAYAELGQWFDNETDESLSGSDTFLAGHYYYFLAPLMPNRGYMFAQRNDITADLVGDAESEYLHSNVWNDEDIETNRLARFLFRAKDANEIRDAIIAGVTVPVDGANPNFTFEVPDGSNYSVFLESGMWFDHSLPRLMGPSDTFVAGHTYTFGAFLKPSEGYAFADPYDMSAVLLGDAANHITQEGIVSYYDDYGLSPSRSISFRFKAKTAPISDVIITGVVEPVSGEVPTVNWGVPEGVNYTAYSDAESWYDETEKRVLKPTDPFIEGNTYSLHVWLATNDGYAFAPRSEMTATLDGVDSAVAEGMMINYPDVDIRIAEFAFVAKAARPKVIEGMLSRWVQGSNLSLSFTSNAEFSDFIAVEIDGKEIEKESYEVTEGSTVVTLNPAFLETLALGNHEITLVFKSGEASTTFDILAKANPNKNEENDEVIVEIEEAEKNREVFVESTETADSTNLKSVLLCLIASSVVLAMSVHAKKREFS